MAIYRGFIKKNLTELEMPVKGDEIPIIVLAAAEPKDVCPEETCSAFEVKLKAIIEEEGIVLLEMDVENVDFLKRMAKYAIWIGITVDRGSEEFKIEKLIQSYDAIRKETDTKIIIKAERYATQLAKKKQFKNVLLSIPFDVTEDVRHHLDKLESIEKETNLPTITRFSPLKKSPTGGCIACKAPDLDEMKALIEGLKTSDEEKNQLLRALEVMPIYGKKDETLTHTAMAALNHAKRSFISEGFETFCCN